MKKNIQYLTKKTATLLLSSALILTGMPDTKVSADSKTDTSSFSTLTRVYDTNNDGLIRYHLEDEAGNTVTTDAASTAADTHKKSSNIPASYDLRTVNAVSAIKDQGITGCCWAFAAIKSIESNLALQGLSNNTLDLSESHLAWYTYHPSTDKTDPLYNEGISYNKTFFGNSDEYNEGGTADLATFTLARRSGAVTEETAPFTGNSDDEITKMINSMEDKNDELRYMNDYILTDSACYDNATQDEIKKVIMTVGAIDLSYYHTNNYFNKNTNAYYQTELIGKAALTNANHSVNIIGWDDSYPKENFAPSTPSSDGAWLIANSYGDDFADNGYSWISYEEPSLTEFYSYSAATSDTYDNNYQYDGFGWSSSIADTNASCTQAGNIFTANSESDQNLTAVGIYTLTDNQPYTIYIYRGVTPGYPASGTLVSAVSGTQKYQGYHTVTFDSPVSLKANEHFSVVISYDRDGQNTGYVPLEGTSEKTMSYNTTYNSNTGESFIFNSSSSEWIDTSSKSLRNSLRNNICIKAFTINVDKAEDIPNTPAPDDSSSDAATTEPNATIKLTKKQVILGKGESYTPVVMLTNAAGLSLSYKSNNTSVAAVNSTGTITAKDTGTAKITVTLSSGVSTTLTVKVKTAPSKLTLNPSGKKSIAKGKSFRIKTKLSSDSASNTITYTSSKPAVAKVNAKGRVTAKKKGTAIITVKTYNGVTAKLTVKVK